MLPCPDVELFLTSLVAPVQGLGKAEVHELRSHLNDLSRDNTILKRAVAIQNSRMQVTLYKHSPVHTMLRKLSTWQHSGWQLCHPSIKALVLGIA